MFSGFCKVIAWLRIVLWSQTYWKGKLKKVKTTEKEKLHQQQISTGNRICRKGSITLKHEIEFKKKKILEASWPYVKDRAIFSSMSAFFVLCSASLHNRCSKQCPILDISHYDKKSFLSSKIINIGPFCEFSTGGWRNSLRIRIFRIK